ncbi:nucleoside-diphosphate-sugar epimerase [Novosphingobium sp. SG751A]|uniref:NAD-dependent epimerase/dehydratase family protein n=1 Tax=Novosphingobium sp. SG751A TaxID=2587000 RepID=UPI001555C331|nr:NAD(P)-dependent oxidoreductase [Novosphingobium sp. SG751A]NOW48458.1 nucleoside-diphosphate-sugar epimerase [Novosphingobium sp. SG751A]
MSSRQSQRILLTGAFGGVGEWLVQDLLALGHHVTCLDLPSPRSTKVAKKLAVTSRFDVEWCDLTDSSAVSEVVARVQPDMIVHAAAIIPPLSVKKPKLARAVNVGGTEHLLTAASALPTFRRLVFVSSYSVGGPINPHRTPAPWDGNTQPAPQDDYGLQKAEAEGLVRTAGLPWTIIRLCAVFPLTDTAPDPDTLTFSFALPYDRREHAIDVRDAAYAIAQATVAEGALNRLFVLGGGEGWQGIGGELTGAMMTSSGLPPLPATCYRQADPARDETWFYENWVDTRESQAVLNYQQHSFSEFLAERRKRMGMAYYLVRLLSPIIFRVLKGKSPYLKNRDLHKDLPFSEAAARLLRKD